MLLGRVALLATRARLELTLVLATIDLEPARTGAWTLIPSYAALRLSRDALYERAALAYYRSNY